MEGELAKIISLLLGHLSEAHLLKYGVPEIVVEVTFTVKASINSFSYDKFLHFRLTVIMMSILQRPKICR